MLDLLARAYGLTVRERELITCIVDGLDTREAASRMRI
jgi:hypothetical protein